MLKKLELSRVGPAPHLGPIELGERLNLLTGDNGLGKSFLLDVTWWALTGTWPDRPAWPREDSTREAPAEIRALVAGKTTDSVIESHYDYDTRGWTLKRGRPPMPGLVLYFRVDGRFSLWDPAQHYGRRGKFKPADDPTRPEALHLDPDEVYNSLQSDDGKTICRGLIEDWVTWQQTRSPEFVLLQRILIALSPGPGESLTIGEPLPPLMLDPDDRRAHPTLQLSYGRTPVVLASAGMKRILALSYLLVWAFQQHRLAAQAQRREPERRLVILFDEPETHLSPQWQRRLLPALMEAAAALGEGVEVQTLVSTHAPLVLASVESRFDEARDRLFHIDIDGGVHIDSVPFAKRGDVLKACRTREISQGGGEGGEER